jgi:hypothetical protein
MTCWWNRRLQISAGNDTYPQTLEFLVTGVGFFLLHVRPCPFTCFRPSVHFPVCLSFFTAVPPAFAPPSLLTYLSCPLSPALPSSLSCPFSPPSLAPHSQHEERQHMELDP